MPVIPLSDGHALSVGIFTHRDVITFGACADPLALPEAGDLPAALSASLLALEALGRPRLTTGERRPRLELAPRRTGPARTRQKTGVSV